MKFRTAKKTFQRDDLIARLGLTPLNDLPEVEAYGRGPRVKCKNLRGPWQEVQIAAYSWKEIGHAGVLGVSRESGRRLQQIRPAHGKEPRGIDAVEGAGPQVAPGPQGFFPR